MPKSLTEAEVTTKAARQRLKVQTEPHWRRLDKDTHLGYRKQGKHHGEWLVRWRVHPGYKRLVLGAADDVISAGCLSFDAAEREARKRVEAARREAKAMAEGTIPTIASVVRAYIEGRDARDSRRRGRAVHSDAHHRLERHVIGREQRGKRKAVAAAKLASVPFHALTEDDLRKWRDGLPDRLKVSDKRRTINDLKAALNAGYATHKKRLDPALRDVIRDGLKADGNGFDDDDGTDPSVDENQILSDAEVRRLLHAARDVDAEEGYEGDLYRMAIVLATTGARFSQVARMRVSDYQRDRARLMVPASRKGRNKSAKPAIPVPVGAEVLDALLPVTVGRSGKAFLLERWRHKQAAGGITWKRDRRGPWQTPSEFDRPWKLIRGQAKLPGVIAYALRHSSIVRGIRKGLPIRLVAALHDTSVVMIERHYAKFIAHGLEEITARAIVPLLPKDGDKVVALR